MALFASSTSSVEAPSNLPRLWVSLLWRAGSPPFGPTRTGHEKPECMVSLVRSMPGHALGDVGSTLTLTGPNCSTQSSVTAATARRFAGTVLDGLQRIISRWNPHLRS